MNGFMVTAYVVAAIGLSAGAYSLYLVKSSNSTTTEFEAELLFTDKYGAVYRVTSAPELAYADITWSIETTPITDTDGMVTVDETFRVSGSPGYSYVVVATVDGEVIWEHGFTVECKFSDTVKYSSCLPEYNAPE